MVVCSAYGCKSRSDRKQPGITFHRLPLKNRRIRDLWINNMNMKNWVPTANSRLCSKHFVKDSFYTVGMKTCLLNDAIPTIFENMQPNIEFDWKRTKKVKETTEDSRDIWEHIIVEYSDTEPSATLIEAEEEKEEEEDDCGVLCEHIIVDFSEIMNTNATEIEDIVELMNGSLENESSLPKIFINKKQKEDIKFATTKELRKRLYKELVKNKEKSKKIRTLGQKLKRYKHRIMSLQQILQELKSNNLNNYNMVN